MKTGLVPPAILFWKFIVESICLLLKDQQYVAEVRARTFSYLDDFLLHINEPSITGLAIGLLFKFCIAGGIIYLRDILFINP